MKSYGHYCGLARALDVIGDRWTLLVVRELMLLGPSRYTDLQQGLPGIATNLLVKRLRELEAAGLVVREAAPPPTPAVLFRLTARGMALEPTISALGAWAGPLMGEYRTGDEFRSHWLSLPVRLYLTDRHPSKRPVVIEVRTGDESIVVETVDGGVRARPGVASNPDGVLSGPPDMIMGLLMGRMSLGAARRQGVHFHGDVAALARLGPRGGDPQKRADRQRG